MKERGFSASSIAQTGGLALGAVAAAAYLNGMDYVAEAPKLWLGNGPLRERVLPHCSTLLNPYNPTPWAANRHAQTILGFLRGLTIRCQYNRQLILTPDGATLGLDWYGSCDATAFAPPDTPVLMVCHGINGGSHEGYCKWVCAGAAGRGWRAVVLNYRGCNGLPFTAPRGYAATMSHDVFTAVYSVKSRFPDAPIMAVGYSLGGLKLTKYLGEADAGLHLPHPGAPQLFEGSGLAAAAVVSSPVSLWHSAANLSDTSSVNFLYNLAVAHKLREHISHHRRAITATTQFPVERVLSGWTMQQIEDNGLPASFGFANRHEYYEAAASLDYIPTITTPTLILLAEDDPFLGVIPDAECARNPSTLLAVTRRGGHVAFLQGVWPLGRAYMDDAVLDFFGATLEHLHGVDPRATRRTASVRQEQQQAAAARQRQSGVGNADGEGREGCGGSGSGGQGRWDDGMGGEEDGQGRNMPAAVRAAAGAAAAAAMSSCGGGRGLAPGTAAAPASAGREAPRKEPPQPGKAPAKQPTKAARSPPKTSELRSPGGLAAGRGVPMPGGFTPIAGAGAGDLSSTAAAQVRMLLRLQQLQQGGRACGEGCGGAEGEEIVAAGRGLVRSRL